VHALLVALAAASSALAHDSIERCGRAALTAAGDDPPPARYAPDRDFDLLHTALDLRIDLDQGSIAGTSAITAASLHDDLEQVRLHAIDLQIEQVRLVTTPGPLHGPLPLGTAVPLPFEHRGEIITIDLTRPFAGGERFTLAVDYRGRPRRGLNFIGPAPHAPDRAPQAWSQGEEQESRYWFPSWDYPNDRGTSSARYTVDRRYTVIGNGALLGVDEGPDDTRIWRWYESQPHVTYLISVAIGELDEFHDTWGEISVDYYVPAGLAERIPRNFGTTPAMLTALSDYLEFPYPYEKYAQVAVDEFMFGGMENISATTLNAASLRDATAYDEGRMDDLVAHELAHQWFGDMITCRDWSHIWLNEGFATYGEVLVTEALDGWEEATIRSLDALDGYLGSGERRAIVERRYEIAMDLFDEHAYAKGSRVLHLLRFELGEELFQRALAHYTESRAWKNVTTQDLVDAIEESTGRSMERFFDQWVRGPGHPELEMSWSWDEALSVARVELRQTQDVGDGATLFQTDFEVAVLAEDGEPSLHRGRIEGAQKEVSLPLSGAPASVILDPRGWLLAAIEEDLPADELARRLERLSELAATAGGAYPVARIRTARALGEAGESPLGVAALDAALTGDPHHRVRSAAARALGAVGGAAARDALLAAASDRDPRVRASVAEALGAFVGDDEAARALRRMAKKDPGYGPRAAALEALVSIGAPGAAKACRKGLEMPSFQEQIRRSALDGLMAVGQTNTALKAARELLRDEPSSWIRSHSATILGRCGARLDPETEAPRRRALRLELQALTTDFNYYVREDAVAGLARLGDPAAIPTLRRVAVSDPDPRMTRAAEEAIAEIHGWHAQEDEGPFELGRRLGDLERSHEELEQRLERLEGLLEARHGETAGEAEESAGAP